MKVVSLVLGECNLDDIKGDIIGVDYGAYYCSKNKLNMVLACGDFDSIDKKHMELIGKFADKIDVLNPVKDETDFTYALSQCDSYDKVYILGGLGRRRDHEYLIVRTVSQDSRLVLKDKQNKIVSYDQGVYPIKKDGYTYCSILPIEPSTLTLEGFKYPLINFSTLGHEDILTSNEIINEVGTLHILEGKVLFIQSND